MYSGLAIGYTHRAMFKLAPKIETPKALGSDLLYILTQANPEIFFFVLYLLSVCMINFNKGGRSSFQK